MLESLGSEGNANPWRCLRNGFVCLKYALAFSLVLHAAILATWRTGDTQPLSGVGRPRAPLTVSLPDLVALSAVGELDAKIVSKNVPEASADAAKGLNKKNDPSLLLIPSEALTEMPSVIGEVEVGFPEVEQPRAGLVRLKLAVSASGRVMSVDLLDTDLPSEYVERAISTFARQRFSPGKIGQLEVPTAIEIEVSFDPYGIF